MRFTKLARRVIMATHEGLAVHKGRFTWDTALAVSMGLMMGPHWGTMRARYVMTQGHDTGA